MPQFEIPIVYRGQCNFIVDADTAEQAADKAEQMFKNGQQPVDLGNEWEEFERAGTPQLVKPAEADPDDDKNESDARFPFDVDQQ